MANFVPKTCRLCLNNVTDFKVVDEFTKEMISVVLQQLIINEKYSHSICVTCSDKLFAAYNFKTNCLYVEDNIVTYVNCKGVSQVDIRNIYFEVQDNKDIKIGDREICRLCLQIIDGEYLSLNEVNGDLKKFIPDINCDLTEEPLVCQTCVGSLKIHCEFIEDCLSILEKIYNINESDKTNGNINVLPDLCVKTEGVDVSEENEKDFDKVMKVEYIDVKSEVTEEDSMGPSELNMMIANDSPESKPIDCRLCAHKSKNIFDLQAHLCLAHKVRLMPCKVCGFKAMGRHDYNNHKLTHWDEKIMSYKCSFCSFNTKLLGGLGVHMLRHKDPSNIKWYSCKVCDFKTRYKGSLKGHTTSHYRSLETHNFTCTKCPYRTNRLSSLKWHQMIHTGVSDENKLRCYHCDFKTNTKNNLREHLIMHRDESEVTMIKCELCDYQARTKKKVKQHMLKHKDVSEVTIFNCDKCNFGTRYKSSLKMHMIVHKDQTEAKKFVCEVCGFRALRESFLEQHKVRHADPGSVEMFDCTFCPYQARIKATLRKHIRLHHKKGVEVNIDARE